MRRLPFVSCRIVILLGVSACVAGTDLSGTAVWIRAGESSAQQVERRFHDGVAAFNEQNLERVMEQWDEDIRIYAAETGWLRDRRAVRERSAATFQRFPAVQMESMICRSAKYPPAR